MSNSAALTLGPLDSVLRATETIKTLVPFVRLDLRGVYYA